MKPRRYCVTVMDNWTPMRTFFTRRRAARWRNKFHGHAHLYVWINDAWRGPMV